MVLTNKDKQILKEFKKQLRVSGRVDIATAWATEGPALDALEAATGSVRIRVIVGLYGNATTPEALDRLGEIAKLRLPRDDTAMFHPKVYIFRKNKRVTAMVGSANLTKRGFTANTEVICEAKHPMDVLQWFDLRWRECGKLDQSGLIVIRRTTSDLLASSLELAGCMSPMERTSEGRNRAHQTRS